MLKIGLLGAGRIGQVHAAAISAHPDSVLAAVSDVYVPGGRSVGPHHMMRGQSSDELSLIARLMLCW